jgi:uncharacterized membrane protein
MEELVIVALFIGLGALMVVILSIVAFSRTTLHRERLDRLTEQLDSALARIATLERSAARHRAASAPPAAEVTPKVVPPSPAVPVQPPVPPPERLPLPKAPEPVRSSSPPPGPAVPEPVDVQDPAPVVELPVAAGPGHPIAKWLFSGNPLAKLGVVLLFFGLAYLLRFASERGMLPIELRLAGAAAIAMGLLGVGWRLRERSPGYALTLQGGSIGALYLTSFAAFRVYGLLPSPLVFGLLVVICAACVTLAVVQRAQSLALLASLGGYGAPVLLSTGGGNHVALFSYYGLLSAGILAVSVWQAWRPLNLIGFAFTFGIGALWGQANYDPSLYVSSQLFLAMNLLIYGVVTVLMALRHGDTREAALVDGTLAFGTPLVGFGLQVGLTRHWTYGPAFSALAYGALYLPLAWVALQRWPERGRRLTASFLALGAGFVTLAIPLALSARWTSMAWALEGLGVLWIGRVQRQARITWSGTGLLALAGVSGGLAWTAGVDTSTFLMLSATLSLCWLAGAWLWSRAEDLDGHATMSTLLLFGGILVWLVMIAGGSGRLMASEIEAGLLGLLWMSASAFVWRAAGRRLAWSALGVCAFLLWPVALLVLPFQIATDGHPLGSGPWSAVWMAALGIEWQVLRSYRQPAEGGSKGLPMWHALFWWLAFGLATTEASWALNRPGWGADEWPVAGLLIVSSLFVLAVSLLAGRGHWAPLRHPRAYWLGALGPAGLVALVLLILGNQLDGQVPGLRYIPLMNVLEEPAAFALLMGAVWYRSARPLLTSPFGGVVRATILALVVWWVNGVLLRTLALIGGVSWSFEGLWESTFVQTSMALAWTAGALACMWIAARSARRAAWFAGATALGVVVVKLFLVDSAHGGGLARAVAFIGVALLVLLIGYVAPLPPREAVKKGLPA